MSEDLLVQDNGVIARAEIDTMISTAKAYPRDPKRSVEYAIMLATMDEETAQSCFYALPRKDKNGGKIEIKGPSIRLAEIMASSWGNIHAATRIVEVAEKYITTEGVCWDLESNTKVTMPNKVSIWFGEKNGKGGYRANTDMQTMLSNASCSKALRNAIFRVIPKALVDKVYQKAMESLVGDAKSVNSKVTKVVDKLVKMGLDKQLILDYYGHENLSQFTADDLTSLIGIGTALKEGMVKLEEIFAVEKTDIGNSSAADRVNELIASKSQPRLTETVNGETGEIQGKNDDDLPY